jgi:NTE family protein
MAVLSRSTPEPGKRCVFDGGSGVGLADAVTASGVLPGVFPLVPIDGTPYADGGVHSPFNADLAAGNERVVMLPVGCHYSIIGLTRAFAMVGDGQQLGAGRVLAGH